MRFNFKEKAIKLYRVLQAQYLPEGSRRKHFVKKAVYRLALFLAKRNGFLLFFFIS